MTTGGPVHQVKLHQRGGRMGCLGILLLPSQWLPEALFASKDVFGVQDRRISRLGFARSLAGFASFLVIGFAFNENGANDTGAQAVVSVATAYLAGGIALIIGVIFLAWRASSGWSYLLIPVRTYFLAWLLFFVLLLITREVFPKIANPPANFLFVPFDIWWFLFVVFVFF